MTASILLAMLFGAFIGAMAMFLALWRWAARGWSGD
jgi:hypothetical protein